MNKQENVLLLILLILIAGILLMSSCGNSSSDSLDPTDSQQTQFDRSEMLVNITDNIIIPAYNNLSQKIENLDQKGVDFINNTNQNNLNELRKSWFDVYKAWQYVEMFNIGKAEEISYMKKMNTYPTDFERIENNISTKNYDLVNNDNNLDAQGLPALDYMLYGLDNDSNQILNVYLSENGADYISYLQELIQQIKSNTDIVITYWDNNRNDFVNSTENTATSSLNMLTNDFIYYYEKGFRANKIGIPAGIFSQVLPDRVEAYYKRNISKKLALEALKACEDFFVGKSFLSEEKGKSLETYLIHLNAQNGTLANKILDRFTNARNQINNLDDNFVYQIENNNLAMLQAYDAIQENTRNLKTDMLSALNIAVDYIDADGD
tara:strand:+ start:6760 stop:7896 length:1137 start_codon:yes stop_codon:yes gene_type:complete